MNQDRLRIRTKEFIKESQSPISAFAREIGFARTTYYKWINKELDFGKEKCERINAFLFKFGF